MSIDGHTEAPIASTAPSSSRSPGPGHLDVLRSRPVRRVVVTASALLLLSAVLVVWFDPDGSAARWHAGYLIVVMLALAGFALVNLAVRPHRDGADERLASVRDSAYRTSYRILGTATGVMLLFVSVAWEAGWAGFTLDHHHIRAMLLAFIAGAVWLPAAVLVWTEPDI